MTVQPADYPIARPFEDIPVIDLPEGFERSMPQFLAEMALVHGPVFRSAVSPERRNTFGPWTVHLVGPEANRFVLQSHRALFSHEHGWNPHISAAFERGLLNSDDPEHDMFRRATNPGFTMNYMKQYLPVMQRVVRRHAEDWVERTEVDLYSEAREIAFEVAAETLLGLTDEPELSVMREAFYVVLHPEEHFSHLSEPEGAVHILRARFRLNDILMRCIQERRTSHTDDVLGMLSAGIDEEGKPFSDTDLLGQVQILLAAGHETTTTLVAWLFRYLDHDPDYLSRVVAEIDDAISADDGEVTMKTVRSTRLLGYAIEEAGRLCSPVAFLPRRAVEDISAFGYCIPAGTYIELAVAAGHRLPNIFAHPEEFDPDRFSPPREEDRRTPYALTTFGGGPRICVGINFALVAIKVIAMHLLSRYVLTSIETRLVEHAYYSPVATVRGGIWVKVSRRTS